MRVIAVITILTFKNNRFQFWQYKKQFQPNEVTDEGMVIELKPLQPWKQLSPIEVPDEGMVIEVKLVQ